MTGEPALTLNAFIAGSRGTYGGSYHLITPSNHHQSPIANFTRTILQKLVTPRNGVAQFSQCLLDIAVGGGSTEPIAPGFEHFLYVLRGVGIIDIGSDIHRLDEGGFVYIPEASPFKILGAEAGARLLWTKRRYEALPGKPSPAAFSGHRNETQALPTSVSGLTRRELLPPDDASFDFNMSILSFAPGVRFQRVEVHDEEHGLFMTLGQCLYYLDGNFHEVQQDDFIYMAPYCPQYVYATGQMAAEYLLYKDVFRDGF